MATARMTYLQHLEEFRRRIIVSFVALVAAFAVSWLFAWDILDILKRPAGNLALHYMAHKDGPYTGAQIRNSPSSVPAQAGTNPHIKARFNAGSSF